MAAARSLRAFGYALPRALAGMRRQPWVQLRAIATMSVCLVLLGVAALALVHVRAVADAWGFRVPLTVYLSDDATAAATEDLERRLRALPEVETVDRVDGAAALEQLREALGDEGELLAGLEPDVMPTTLEVRLRDGAVVGAGARLAERLRPLPAVEDAVVLGPWAERGETLIATAWAVAIAIGVLVVLACVAVVWSTVGLFVHARRAELTILGLVGATPRFVRGPYALQGLIHGAAAGVLALGVLVLGFRALRPLLEDGLAFVLAGGGLRFFGAAEMVGGISAVALVGLFAGRAAVAREAR